MKRSDLSVSPEPAPDEREALEAALAQQGEEVEADAWSRAALREGTERDPSA